MFGSAVDLAIGLVFVFLLLSVITSGINEWIAKWTHLRAKHLEAGIRKLLGDPGLADAFFSHPSIMALSSNEGRINLLGTALVPPEVKGRKPSYIPATAFATTLVSIIGRSSPAPPTGAGGEPLLSDLTNQLETWLLALPNSDLQRNLQLLVTQADTNVDRFMTGLETWFDDAMDRVSGWYKRNTKRVMLVIGIAIAFTCNVDAVLLAKTLWIDAPLRASVAAQAQNAVTSFSSTPTVTPVPTTTNAESPTSNESATASTRAPCPTRLDASSDPTEGGTAASIPPGDSLACVAQQIEQIQSLHIPIGWTTNEDDPRHPKGPAEIALKVAGLLATAVALSFGAPFWFDMLGKLTNLRSSGPPPSPPKTE